MSSKANNRETPNWIFVASVIFIGWNMTGAVFYLNEMFMGPEMFDTMSSAQQDFFSSRPAWVTASYATAVWVHPLTQRHNISVKIKVLRLV